VLVEPVGDLPAFFLDDHLVVPAARCNHDGKAVGFFFRRQENVNGRIVNKGEISRQLGVDVFLNRRLLKDLLLRHTFRSWSAARPELDLLAALSSKR
jgi:hypothetical protein